MTYSQVKLEPIYLDEQTVKNNINNKLIEEISKKNIYKLEDIPESLGYDYIKENCYIENKDFFN